MVNRYLVLLIFINSGFCYGQGIVDNAKKDRVIKVILLDEIGDFYPSNEGLFRPELIAYDALNGRFYVYDYGIGNLVAVQLDKESFEVQEIIEIGNGVGSGPGEFRNPTSMCLSHKSQKLVLADPDLARITIWSLNDYSLKKSFRPEKFMPFRIACDEERIMIYTMGFNREGVLASYNYEGDFLSYVKEPGRNKSNVSIMESGFLCIYNESVFYSGTDSEILKKYSVNENKLTAKNAFVSAIGIDNKLKTSKDDQEVSYRRSEESLYASRGIGVTDNFLMVFYSGRKDAYGNIIDFYSLEDLSYVFSTKIEGLANKMVVNGGELLLNTYDYDRKENFIKVYKISDDEM